MKQATTPSWSRSVAIHEADELDWSVEPPEDSAQPIPLVRRRAAPRPGTLAGVGGPDPRAARTAEVDDLSW